MDKKKKGFDTTVHVRDRKSGKITSSSPYRLRCTKIEGGAQHVYERDGKKFNPDGSPYVEPAVEKAPTMPQTKVQGGTVGGSVSAKGL